MGFFHPQWDLARGPEPGPQPKGTWRLFQLVLENLWDYVKANFLCCLCLLPALAAGAAVLLLTGNYPLFSLTVLLAGIPSGGALAGLHRVLNRSVRNLGSKTWDTFRKGFRDNFRCGILPGALVLSELLLCMYMLLFREAISAFPLPFQLWGLLGLTLVFLHGLSQYSIPLMVLVDLPLRDLLRNSLILLAAKPKAAFLSFLWTGLCLGTFILFFPWNWLLVLTLGPALTGLVQQMLLWPVINQFFHVEEP